MMRSYLFVLALVVPLSTPDWSSAALRDEIIPETFAARHGLTRVWFSQVQLDRARARVAHVLLHNGTLFVQTDQAVLHAMNAETGQSLWAVRVGHPGHPSMRPAANSDFVATINGSRLYIINRHNGRQLWETQVGGAPGAGPALSEQRAYVATVTGLVLSYWLKPIKDPRVELEISQAGQTEENLEGLEQERRDSLLLEQEYVPPLACQSTGRAIVQPIITREHSGEEFVAWPTDRGYLFIGRVDRQRHDQFVIRCRLETAMGIAAQPTYLQPDPEIVGDSGIIYAASRDGYVHAIREKSGAALWRFSTGEPLVEPAVVVDKRVFAATQPGGMYCLDAKTGSQLWWAPQLIQFIAASAERAYVVDRLGRMVVLDVKTGARLDAIPFPPRTVRMINDLTDRIYLVSETGLVQCLREIENADPIQHRSPIQPKSPPTRSTTPPASSDQIPPDPMGQPTNPFEASPKPNPFGGGADNDNPFGAFGSGDNDDNDNDDDNNDNNPFGAFGSGDNNASGASPFENPFE